MDAPVRETLIVPRSLSPSEGTTQKAMRAPWSEPVRRTSASCTMIGFFSRIENESPTSASVRGASAQASARERGRDARLGNSIRPVHGWSPPGTSVDQDPQRASQ